MKRLMDSFRKSAVRVVLIALAIVAATGFAPITPPAEAGLFCEVEVAAPYDGLSVYGIGQVTCNGSALLYLTVRMKFNGTVVQAITYKYYGGWLRGPTDAWNCPAGFVFQASAVATVYARGYAPLTLHTATGHGDC